MPTLMIANPPRRRSTRKASRRRRRSAAPAFTARAFSAVPRFTRRKGRRRSSGGGGLSLGGGGMMNTAKTIAIQGAAGAAGFVAAEMLVDKLPVKQLKEGKGRILGKFLIGIAGALLLSRVSAGRKYATAFGIGATSNAGKDLYNQWQLSRANSGGNTTSGSGGGALTGLAGVNYQGSLADYIGASA